MPLIDAERTRAAAQALKNRDAAFDEQRLYARLTDAFEKIQRAWCDQDLSPVRAFISDGVFERFSLQIQEQRDLGWRDRMEHLHVQDVRLAQVSSGDVFTAAPVRIAASAINDRISLADGSRLPGSRAAESFVEFWTWLRRSDAQTVVRDGLIEGRCPNCGAALEMNQNARCPHCQSILRSGRFDWVLVEITQESEWRPTDRMGRSVPGLDDIRQRDPELTLAEIEDRASVLFWRWVMAQRLGDASLLERAAGGAFLAQIQQELTADESGGRRSWLGECAVGAVDTMRLIGAAEGPWERAVVEVRWMGTRFERRADAKPERLNRSSVLRTLLVLGRDPSARSDADHGVSSAHCPNCGAPEIKGNGPHCAYCGIVLNDGKHGWVLLELLSAVSERGQALLEGDAQSGQLQAAGGDGVAPSSQLLLAWLAKMAFADGQVDEQERRMIESAAARRHVPAERLRAILSAAEAGDIEPPVPTDREQARQWLEALALSAWADGRLAAGERELLTRACAHAGLGAYDLKLLLSRQRHRMLHLSRQALRQRRRARR
jgi:hypothetical protein